MNPKHLIPLSLRIRLGRCKRRLLGLPEPTPAAAPPYDPRAIYGWSADARELSIDTPEPPHGFTNILFNDAYFTAIDQLARGQGRHLTRTGWVNNVIEGERLLYVRREDTGAWFCVPFAPSYVPFGRFRATIGPNFLAIENETHGLAVTWRIWVPTGDDPLEVWDVSVATSGPDAAPVPVSLFSHVVMPCDGTDLYAGELCRLADWLPAQQAVFVRQDAERHTQIDFPRHNGFMTCEPAPVGWNARAGVFCGPRRSLANPLAVEAGQLQGQAIAVHTPHVELHVRLHVPAGGAAATARFLAGACAGEADIARLRARYLGPAGGEAQAHSAAALRQREQALRLETPEPTVDRMLNSWVQTQVRLGATWCKWGWKGYRDVLQHAMAVAALDAPLARRALVDAARHQHADGFGVQGWNPVVERRYCDMHGWLVLAATHYLRETADFALLEEPLPFLEGGAPASFWEHLVRAMRRYQSDRGPHGLLLMFTGDWNDSLTGLCRAGRGESIMGSMLACRAASELATLAELRAAHLPGAAAFAAELRTLAAELRAALNTHAWDGAWYVAGLDDEGQPVGSARCREGQIHLVPQAWAQLAGLCEGPEGAARWASAWAAARQRLDSGWGLLLCDPPYTQPDPAAGRITFIQPGHNENASVYTHGTAFAMAALLERGQADEALALWHSIVPNSPARPGACQPNVFFNGFYGPASRLQPGLADHSWFTGSSAWMLRNVAEGLLGLRADYDGLHIRPCLPGAWQQVRVRRVFRGTAYEIRLLNPSGRPGAPVSHLLVQGQPHDPAAALPLGGPGIVQVEVDLG